MHFYEALQYILNTAIGAKITRKSWNGKLFVSKGFENKSYSILIATLNKNEYYDFIPYSASSEDMTASDWMVL